MAPLIVRALFTALVAEVALGERYRRKSRAATGEGQKQMGSSNSSQARALWDAYVQRTTEEHGAVSGVQRGCEPQFHEKTSSGHSGTIMLFHGFTACPQQFDKLIPLLTRKGYDVLVPLTPGHGYVSKLVRDGEAQDYIAGLPRRRSKYEVFVDEMHGIMQATTKQKVLLGMSLGGAIAARVGQKGGYDRQLLAAPMVRAAGFLDTIMTLAAMRPWMSEKRQSWGDGCEEERSQGRAGICQFTAAIGATARNFGQDSLGKARPVADGTIEIIFVEDDQAVNTVAVQNLALKYGIDRSSQFICGMDKVLGHSFLSPYDNPNENKFWLDEATSKVAAYLTTGTALRQDGKIGTWPRCELRSR